MKKLTLFIRQTFLCGGVGADKNTEFARMALDSLVQGHLVQHFNPLAV